MRIAWWVNKVIHTHTHTQNMQYLLLFHRKNGYVNAPRYYVTRILRVLLLQNVRLCCILNKEGRKEGRKEAFTPNLAIRLRMASRSSKSQFSAAER